VNKIHFAIFQRFLFFGVFLIVNSVVYTSNDKSSQMAWFQWLQQTPL